MAARRKPPRRASQTFAAVLIRAARKALASPAAVSTRTTPPEPDDWSRLTIMGNASVFAAADPYSSADAKGGVRTPAALAAFINATR